MKDSSEAFLLLPTNFKWTSDIHVTHIETLGEEVNHRLFGKLTPIRLTTGCSQTIDTFLKVLPPEEQISEHFVLHNYASLVPQPKVVFPAILAYETETCDQYPVSRRATKLIFAKWADCLANDIERRAATRDYYMEGEIFTWLVNSIQVHHY